MRRCGNAGALRTTGVSGIAFSSAFTPKEITGLVFWVIATLGVTSVAGKISAWADQSGNGHHFTQAVGADQPSLTAGVVNGQPVVRFDGAATFLAAIGASGLWSQSFTLCAIANTTSLGGAGHEGQIVGIDVNHYAMTHYQGDTHVYGYIDGGGNSVGTTINTGTWMMPMVWWDGTTNANGMRIYNGSALKQQITSAHGSYPASGDVSIGANGQGPWNGDLPEAFMYNRPLAVAEMTRLVRYSNARYALAL